MVPASKRLAMLVLREIAAKPMQRVGQCELDDVIALLGLFTTPGWHLTGALLVDSCRMQDETIEIIAAAALAGFAGYILFESTKLRIGSFRVPQTGFFPRVLGILLLLLTVGELVSSSTAARKRRLPPSKIASEGWFRIGATLTTMLCFALRVGAVGLLAQRHFCSWCCSCVPSKRRAGRKY